MKRFKKNNNLYDLNYAGFSEDYKSDFKKNNNPYDLNYACFSEDYKSDSPYDLNNKGFSKQNLKCLKNK